jgi:hypothetical protein
MRRDRPVGQVLDSLIRFLNEGPTHAVSFTPGLNASALDPVAARTARLLASVQKKSASPTRRKGAIITGE